MDKTDNFIQEIKPQIRVNGHEENQRARKTLVKCCFRMNVPRLVLLQIHDGRVTVEREQAGAGHPHVHELTEMTFRAVE